LLCKYSGIMNEWSLFLCAIRKSYWLWVHQITCGTGRMSDNAWNGFGSKAIFSSTQSTIFLKVAWSWIIEWLTASIHLLHRTKWMDLRLR
jgi:hypothetical protein